MSVMDRVKLLLKSIGNNLTKNKKYPEINGKYESSNNTNLFFIGSLMHSLDCKKSSGGFIHGFRYLIKFFVNMNCSCSVND